MKTMPEVILRKLILLTVKRETSLIDTVAIATYQSTEVTVDINVVSDRVMSEYDISEIAVLVRDHQRYQTSAIVCYTGFHSVVIDKCVKRSGFTVHLTLEVVRIQARFSQMQCVIGTRIYRQQPNAEH